MPPLPSVGLTRAFMACGTAAASATQQSRWRLEPGSASAVRAEDVLTFWFGAGWRESPPRVEPNYDLWFGGSAETDATIKARFGEDVHKARRGEYNSWLSAGPMEALALIILLDQFALNVFRDLPEGYASSEQAIPLAYTAIARGYPKGPPASVAAGSADGLAAPVPAAVTLPPSMRMFYYLPLMHSELLQDQDECVRLCREMAADEGSVSSAEGADSDATAFAVLHRDIVAKYGRFPGRNKCMGRESTAEEQKYLDEGGIF